jgi:hypothetical protein
MENVRNLQDWEYPLTQPTAEGDSSMNTDHMSDFEYWQIHMFDDIGLDNPSPDFELQEESVPSNSSSILKSISSSDNQTRNHTRSLQSNSLEYEHYGCFYQNKEIGIVPNNNDDYEQYVQSVSDEFSTKNLAGRAAECQNNCMGSTHIAVSISLYRHFLPFPWQVCRILEK